MASTVRGINAASRSPGAADRERCHVAVRVHALACARASREAICGAEPMELTPIFSPLESVSRLNPGLAIAG